MSIDGFFIIISWFKRGSHFVFIYFDLVRFTFLSFPCSPVREQWKQIDFSHPIRPRCSVVRAELDKRHSRVYLLIYSFDKLNISRRDEASERDKTHRTIHWKSSQFTLILIAVTKVKNVPRNPRNVENFSGSWFTQHPRVL